MAMHDGYLIGCDNELAKLHTRHPEACSIVGGVIIMHIDDLWEFVLLWLLKTEEVQADKAHYATNITGDIYQSGWISEMYGYSFGAAELELRHLISSEILIYPGYVPEAGVKYRVFHYGLEFKVGNWRFDKAKWRDADVVNRCWATFPDPPDPSTLEQTDEKLLQRDLLSIECAKTLNEALRLHHKRRNCPDPTALSDPKLDMTKDVTSSRKFCRFAGNDYMIKGNPVPINHSQESSLPKVTDGLFSTLRFWIILLWVFSGLGFMLVMLVVFSSYTSKGSSKGKSNKSRRRSYTGFLK